MDAAFLIGISKYCDHRLQGVPADIALLKRALEYRNYPSTSILSYLDTHTTQSQLHELFGSIRDQYEKVEKGSCYIHIGASGLLSLTPLAGGILTTDGDPNNLDANFAFSALNQYLPVRSGIHVVVTLDT